MRAMRGSFATTVLFTLAASVAGLAAARPAAAQDLEPPRPRQGYYMALGLYGAATAAHENGNALGPWFGYGNAFRLGQLVTRRLGLGISVESGRTWGQGQQSTISALGVEANWALWRNLAVRGGIGIGFLLLHDPNNPGESSTRGVTGSWYSLGFGYDFFPIKKRLSGGFSLTPTVQARLVPGTDTSGFIAFFGLELGYWMGLPRNQLELPPSEAFKRR
jgi:hypothetical protein